MWNSSLQDHQNLLIWNLINVYLFLVDSFHLLLIINQLILVKLHVLVVNIHFPHKVYYLFTKTDFFSIVDKLL